MDMNGSLGLSKKGAEEMDRADALATAEMEALTAPSPHKPGLGLTIGLLVAFSGLFWAVVALAVYRLAA